MLDDWTDHDLAYLLIIGEHPELPGESNATEAGEELAGSDLDRFHYPSHDGRIPAPASPWT